MERRLLKCWREIALIFLLLGNANGANWVIPVGEGSKELEFQLDPYYTAVDLVVPLFGDSIASYSIDGREVSLYGEMIRSLPRPRFLLVEASLNPLPIAGVVIKSEVNSFYRSSELIDGFNLVRSMTDGFPEPGALSLFLGNIIDVIGDDGLICGRGYGGFLISWGPWHILNNEMIDDHWIEMEMKLKGGRETQFEGLNWSFAVGGRRHFHHEIHNTLYLAIVRDQRDRQPRSGVAWSFFRNSTIEYRIDFDARRVPYFYRYLDKTAIRYLALYGKKWPVRGGKNLIGLDLGLLRQAGTGYDGSLADNVRQGWSFLLRPRLNF